MTRTALSFLFLAALTSHVWAGNNKSNPQSLKDYLARVQSSRTVTSGTSLGSVWRDDGRLIDLASDYKARNLGDLVTVQIVEQTTSEASASVASARKLDANSGILALAGQMDTNGVAALFSPHSNQTLQGQGQTASKSKLATALTGRVVAVLESGELVIQAERDVLMNNERQHIIVRGIARSGDLSPENVVLSSRLSDLQIELLGKGIISDGVRPPNVIVRWLLRLIGF